MSEQAKVTGPVTGGKRGWPFAASMQDVASLGYKEAEYFIEGTACRYQLAEGAELGRDGRWQVEPVPSGGEAAYKTRMLVYHPADPKDFNGTVIVTWNNVTAGHDLFSAGSPEIFEGGYALACVTTQKAGIEGLPPIHQGLAGWDPERYRDLSLSSDDYSFDIFTQAAMALGPNRDKSGIDPMSGLDVKRVVAQGASQSAGRLGTYYNAIAPLNEVFDGFMLMIYFGRGTALEVGNAVVNIGAPQKGSAQTRLMGHNLLRDDLDVPVFVVNSELEAIACYGVRQDDTDTMRTWETAGTCHVSQQGKVVRQALLDRDEIVSRPPEVGINAVPMNPVYDASYHHMHVWLRDGTPPPITPRIAFVQDNGGAQTEGPAEVIRDDHGNAKGGIRLPQADVPLAQNSAIPLTEDIYAVLGGSSHPFDAGKIKDLYGSRDTFLKEFEAAGRTAVEAGVLLPRDLAGLVEEAGETWSQHLGQAQAAD